MMSVVQLQRLHGIKLACLLDSNVITSFVNLINWKLM